MSVPVVNTPTVSNSLYIVVEPRTANLLSPVCSRSYDLMRSLASCRGGVVSTVKFVEEKFGVKLSVKPVTHSSQIIRQNVLAS